MPQDPAHTQPPRPAREPDYQRTRQNRTVTRPGDLLAMMRAKTGLIAVLVSDIAIAAIAIVGVIYASNAGKADSVIASILGSAFTTIGTMTTAYFGIKAVANMQNPPPPPPPAGGEGPPSNSPGGEGTGEPAVSPPAPDPEAPTTATASAW